eukprot:TRINITY_DN28610_c0_g1_i1.p1 TRINITY_DN28610_c0_g1~~TRINITY_DN28610_c0_g1_i1.p1  ORF type:complete len:482 (+),score=90.48 TRINITY_DN28610_c0_g1_i1:94-1446(+)
MAQALWPRLAAERPASPDLFYLPEAAGLPRPRAILVDSEPKAVNGALACGGSAAIGGKGSGADRTSAAFAFDRESAVVGQSGRGGNFALGYSGGAGGSPLPSMAAAGECPELVASAVERMRRQVERCHGTHMGTVVMHSLGGGTGSGMGTRLVEELRDAIPRAPLVTVSILPLSIGENPMQSLNSLLALSCLSELTDGVVLYENDRLLDLADRGPAAAAGAASGGSLVGSGASLACMNSVIADDLTPFLCPAKASQPFELGDLLSGAWPLPTHRFAQAYSGDAPFGRTACPGASGVAAAAAASLAEVKPAMDALVRGAPRMPKGSGSVLAAHAVVRGAAVDAGAAKRELLGRLGGSVSWQPFCGEVLCSSAPLRSAVAPKNNASGGRVTMSVLLNWKPVAETLRGVVHTARKKRAAGAFAHWYSSYGFGDDMFAQSFEVLEEAIGNYDAA